MGKYGVDVALKRADDLDKKMLAYVSEHLGCSVLDLGCGGGGQSERLAATGAKVTGIDIVDQESGQNEFKFVCADIRNLPEIIQGKKYTIASFQRTIHYLSYNEAKELLKYLTTVIEDKLFVSVSGIESDIGSNYQDKNKPIQDRFCRLDQNDAETFRIKESICLYTPEEFMVLLQECGWQIEECWVSAFGNIKVICVH